MSDAALLRAFVDGLVAAGVRDVVVCPGSRSTPLALALRANGDIRVRVLLDERAAGFFALGLARTARRPVAVLVTSGTAAMELGPAVVEAAYSRVPLVVLTADRPAELRDRGAPQTIDQDHLTADGQVVRRAAALRWRPRDRRARPLDRRPGGRDGVAGPAGPSISTSRSASRCCPTGPRAGRPTRSRRPAVRHGVDDGAAPARRRPARSLARRRIAAVERGLIVAGPQDDPGAAGGARPARRRHRLPDPRRPAVRRSVRAPTTARP